MLAVIIAFVISKPLELKLFEKEINHILLEEKESAINNWVKQQIQQREQMLKAAISIDNQIYKNLTKDEELYNYKQKMARELMKL